jgi:hypothetical protein
MSNRKSTRAEQARQQEIARRLIEQYRPRLDGIQRALDEVTAWLNPNLDELPGMLAIQATTTPETPPGMPRRAKGTTETLTPNDWKLIRAMKDVGAVDSEHAASRDEITKRARTGNADSKHNQESFDRLKRLGLINAARRVGSWLTANGMAAVKGENR